MFAADRRVLSILGALGLSFLAHGAQAAGAGAAAVEQIARINESIAVLTAQKAELELRAQIASRQAELGKTGGFPILPGIAGTAGTAGAARGGQPAAEPALPVVRSIEGMDGKLVAVLSFQGGMLQSVRTGEKIIGDWTVTEIRSTSLTLTRGRETVRLGPAY